MRGKHLRNGAAARVRAANGHGDSPKNGNTGRKASLLHVVASAHAVAPEQQGGTLVLIASADPEIFRWWRDGLSGHYAIERVTSLMLLKESLLGRKPSVLLLDLDLPGLHGMGGVAVVTRLSPSTKTVIIRDALEDREVISALRAGARGNCSASLDPYMVRKVVETVQKGEVWVRRNVVLSLIDGLRAESEGPRVSHDPDPALGRLSAREREIANLVSAGARNKEIAARLSITETTVKAHLTAAFRKLGIPDRLHLALFMSHPKAPASDVKG